MSAKETTQIPYPTLSIKFINNVGQEGYPKKIFSCLCRRGLSLSGFNFSYCPQARREIASERSENERKDGPLLHELILVRKSYRTLLSQPNPRPGIDGIS